MTAGEILRQARVRSGQDLEALSRQTRISRRYLEAIEADDIAGVPGQFFYRSFVRQYAEALGLDASDVSQDLPAAPQPAPVHHFRPRDPEPIVPGVQAVHMGGRATTWVSVLAFIAVVAGCSALYAWYHSRQTAPPVAAQSTRPAPVPAATNQNAPVSNPAAQPTTPAASDTAAVQPPAASPVPAPAPAAPGVGTTAAPSPEDKVSVVVSWKERAWVSLMADGKQVFVGTLDPGQVRTFSGKERARLRVGNAGGIDVMYNGKPIGAIGPRGQVRSVVFTPQGFEIEKPVLKFEEDFEKPGT